MLAHSHDQSSLFTCYCLTCKIDFGAEEINLSGCNTYVQYTLTCNKCKDSIIYHEKGQAIMDKVFHERFARHRVSLREDLLVIREVTN